MGTESKTSVALMIAVSSAWNDEEVGSIRKAPSAKTVPLSRAWKPVPTLPSEVLEPPVKHLMPPTGGRVEGDGFTL